MNSALSLPSLVLNRNWQPINAVPVWSALSKVSSAKAQIIHPDTYEMYNIEGWMDLPVKEGDLCVRTPSQRVKVPEVIVNRYPRLPIRKVHFSRSNLWTRDGYNCQYCGKRPRADEITVDHVVPRSKGGKTTFENTVLACLKCNVKKDNRTPEQANMKLFRIKRTKNGVIREFYHRPKTPVWSPMFSLKRQTVPASWSKFIQNMIEDLYWNTELDP